MIKDRALRLVQTYLANGTSRVIPPRCEEPGCKARAKYLFMDDAEHDGIDLCSAHSPEAR